MGARRARAQGGRRPRVRDDAGARGPLHQTIGWTDCDCEEIPTWTTTPTATARTTAPSTATTTPLSAAAADNPLTSTLVATATKYRPGLVLDPFAGSGTTLAVADLHGRDATGIDFNEANRQLYPARYDEVKRALYGTQPELPGQLDMFEAL